MNIIGKVLAVFAILMFVGCASDGSSGGSKSAAEPSSSSSGGTLSDEKLKEIGISETYDKRQ